MYLTDGKDDHLVCLYAFFFLKPYVLFVFKVYLVVQLVMELFSTWAGWFSGEVVVDMSQGA